MLCTRCACALGEAESSLSDPASSVPPSDFESASQVAGQVSFPQWTSEGGWRGGKGCLKRYECLSEVYPG